MAEGYRNLQVYRKTYPLVLDVYRMTAVFPREELFGLTSQCRRCAASIPLNIAEGYAKRESQAEFKRFLMMAMGSSVEMGVLLDLAKDLSYMKEETYTRANATYDEVRKMLFSLIERVAGKSEI